MAVAGEGGGGGGCVTGVHEADYWVDPISRAEPSRGERTKVKILEWRLKALHTYFPISRIFCSLVSCFLVFFVSQLEPILHYTISSSTILPLLDFDGLTVFRQRGKNTDYTW